MKNAFVDFLGRISTKANRFFKTTNFLLIVLSLVFRAFEQPFDIGDMADEDDDRDDGRNDGILDSDRWGSPESKTPGEDLGVERNDEVYDGDDPCDKHAYR